MSMFCCCDNPSCMKEAEPKHIAQDFFTRERTEYPAGWLQVVVWGGKKLSNFCSPYCVIEFMAELMKPENAQYLKANPISPSGKGATESDHDYIKRKLRELRS